MYVAVESIEKGKTVVLTNKKKQKGKLHMDLVIKTSCPHMAFVEEDMSLVRNLWECQDHLEGFAPRIAGFGQMKLEAHYHIWTKGNQGAGSC